jgi:hypothetical protein
MRAGNLKLASVVLMLVFAVNSASGVPLKNYGLDSLVFASTDIVIAEIATGGKRDATATVEVTLYGHHQPGDRITNLHNSLSPYDPIFDGTRVILFLDSRAHAHRSFSAVVASGVYLIDSDQHVYPYGQQVIQGGYVASGYYEQLSRAARGSGKGEDLKYPTLEQTKADIAAAVALVAPVRSRTDGAVTLADVPFLVHLADATSPDREDCDWRTIYSIQERAMERIQSLGDPEALLRADAVATSGLDDGDPGFSFVSNGNLGDKQFRLDRVNYLIAMLANKRADLTLRLEAATLLSGIVDVERYNPKHPPRPLRLDSPELAGSATKLQSTANNVVDDDSDNGQVRAAALQFLSLDDDVVTSDLMRVYARTHSDRLRYAIEVAFLNHKQEQYASLHSPGGPIASLVSTQSHWGCDEPREKPLPFTATYREAVPTTGYRFLTPAAVLTNLRTKQQVVVEKKEWRWKPYGDSGSYDFDVSLPPGLRPGNYSLALEFSGGNSVVGLGNGMLVAVHRTSDGEGLTLEPVASQ